MSKQLPRLPPGAHAAAPLHLRCPRCARYRDTCSSSYGATCWASRPTSSVAKTCGAIAARRRMSRRTSLMAPLARARRRLSHARGHAVGGAAILIERSSTLKALNKWWRWPEPRLVQASFMQNAAATAVYWRVVSPYRSILRTAVFARNGDATRPHGHTPPHAHARSLAAASPSPDAVLMRLAAQRSNVLGLHSGPTAVDGCASVSSIRSWV